jgi:hypothetical protein
VQRRELFQVRKLRRNSAFAHKVPTERSTKAQERQHLQNAGETKVIGLAEESKVETFETLEIFQVREKFQSSGGGASTTIRSATEGEDLDHRIYVQILRGTSAGETDLKPSDLSAWTNNRWIQRKVHEG